MRRLVFVLADGLRPDAVSPSLMPSLNALGRAFTHAPHAHTVRPSATVAALASLATGVGPDTHRLIEPGLRFLPLLRTLRPVARELSAAGIPVDIVTTELGRAVQPVAWALAMTAGARRLIPSGQRARATAAAVSPCSLGRGHDSSSCTACCDPRARARLDVGSLPRGRGSGGCRDRRPLGVDRRRDVHRHGRSRRWRCALARAR
jgi:hypothetical protein